MGERRLGRLIGLAVLVAAGVGAAIYWLDDERVIRRRLATLAELTAPREREPPLAQVARATGLLDLLDPGIELELHGPSAPELVVQGRPALREPLLVALAGLRSEVSFREVHFTRRPAQARALVQGVAVARVQGSDEPIGMPLQLTWRRTDRVWRIVRVESILPP